jgi:hypothetical protein
VLCFRALSVAALGHRPGEYAKQDARWLDNVIPLTSSGVVHLVEVSVGRVGSDLCDQQMGDIRFVCTKRVATRALLAHAPGARRIASPHRACRAERLRCSAPRFTQRSRKTLCALLYSPTAAVVQLYSSRSCSPCKVVAGCLRLRLKRAAVVLRAS